MNHRIAGLSLILTLGSGWAGAGHAAEVTPAGGTAAREADISSPEWLASYLPSAILVLQPKETEPVQKLFREGLARIQAAKAVRLDDFPSGQVPPKLTQREELVYPTQKSADAGFWVLVSQTGRVVALFTAFSTNKEWAQYAAMTLSKSRYKPAQFNGRAVPVLIPIRAWFEHSISIN